MSGYNIYPWGQRPDSGPAVVLVSLEDGLFCVIIFIEVQNSYENMSLRIIFMTLIFTNDRNELSWI